MNWEDHQFVYAGSLVYLSPLQILAWYYTQECVAFYAGAGKSLFFQMSAAIQPVTSELS